MAAHRTICRCFGKHDPIGLGEKGEVKGEK